MKYKLTNTKYLIEVKICKKDCLPILKHTFYNMFNKNVL